MRRLVLASASPARLSLLQSAGLAPEVVVSAVDEDGTGHLSAAQAVAVLAERKGRSVTKRPEAGDSIVIACDSMLEFEGETWGKADSPEEVIRRWKLMAGHNGQLHTGHWMCDTRTQETAAATGTTTVHFGRPTDDQIAAYAATDESRRVAGPFTMEGRSAPWITGIEGNAGNVMGLSMPIVTDLLREIGIEITDLWA